MAGVQNYIRKKKAKGKKVKPQVYQTVISALGRGGRRDEALALLLNGMEMDGVKPSVECCNAAMAANKHNIPIVYNVLSRMKSGLLPSPTTVTYNIALSAFASTQDGLSRWKEALALFAEMESRGLEPSVITWNTLINVLGKSDQLKKALKMFNSMEEQGLLPTQQTYGTILSACARRGKAMVALSIFKQIPEPDLRCYNVLLHAFSEGQEMAQALALLHKMQSKGEPAPDRVSYNSVLACCAAQGAVEEAHDLMRQMKAEGIAPDTITYNCLLQVESISHGLEGALKVLRAMKRARVRRNAITYGTVIGSCSSGEDALEWLERAEVDEKIRPDVVMYGSAIKALAGGAMWESGLDLLDRARNDGLRLTEQLYTSSFGCMAQGRLDGAAVALLDEMEADAGAMAGPQPGLIHYNACIHAQARAANWSQALSLMLRMRERGFKPDETTWTSCLSAMARAGEWELAKRYLGRMMSEHGEEPRTIHYNCVISACAQAGHPLEAEEVLKEMEAKGLEPDQISYGALLRAYAQVGDSEGAESLVASMSQQGIPLTLRSYSSLLTCFAKCRDHIRALAAMDQLERQGVELDEVSFTSAVIACAADEAALARVVSSIEKSPKRPFSVVLHNLLIRAACGDLAADAVEEKSSQSMGLEGVLQFIVFNSHRSHRRH
ncbi:unnamed protein product [Chrysoparadoxa australica]